MNNKEKIKSLWNDLDKHDWDNIYEYFHNNAVINWINTNEQFDVRDFVRANSEYPGQWSIEVERLESIENLVISVVKVHLKDGDLAFHATSFFEFSNDKIKILNEYWGQYEKAPQWRIDKGIGKPIYL